MNTFSLIQKAWNFCHTLRNGGMGYVLMTRNRFE